MITSWDIYWITRLDSICILLVAMCVVLVLFMVFFPLIGDMAFDLKTKVIVKWEIIFASIFFTIALCGVFIPSTKEFAVIYLAPKVINNEQVQKVPDNALKLLNKKMEEWINDIDNKKEK